MTVSLYPHDESVSSAPDALDVSAGVMNGPSASVASGTLSMWCDAVRLQFETKP